jgi:hypothetical protein
MFDLHRCNERRVPGEEMSASRTIFEVQLDGFA